MSKFSLTIILGIVILLGFVFKTNIPITSTNLVQVEKCFLDGQIPCLWVSDYNQNYGFPYFISNSPLIYYLAMPFRLIGLSYSLSLYLVIYLLIFISIYCLYKLKISPYLILFFLISSFYLSGIIIFSLFCLLLYFLKRNFIVSSLIFTSIIMTLSFDSLFLIPILIFLLFILHPCVKTILITITGIFISSFYLGPLIFENNIIKTLPNYPPIALNYPLAISGLANISEYKTRSQFWRFTITVNQTEPTLVVVPKANYPGWTYLINSTVTLPLFSQPLNLTTLFIPSGNHTITAFFENTPTRTFFHLLSLISIISLIVISFPINAKKLN